MAVTTMADPTGVVGLLKSSFEYSLVRGTPNRPFDQFVASEVD